MRSFHAGPEGSRDSRILIASLGSLAQKPVNTIELVLIFKKKKKGYYGLVHVLTAAPSNIDVPFKLSVIIK